MNNIYQHFRQEERTFIDRSLDLLDRVEYNYETITTDFLNPRQVFILTSLAYNRGLLVHSSSELIETELVKLIIAPDFYLLNEDDFDLSLIEIDYPSKFSSLSHSQILGNLLGQSGVDRSKFGDILVSSDCAQFFVDSKLSDFMIENIKKISRTGVKLKKIPLSQALELNSSSLIEKVLTVSSLRLDKIIAATFNISRNTTSSLIDQKLVKLNYSTIDKKESMISPGDLISVRGYGRVKLVDILSMTKKGKEKIKVEITKNKK
jgi:Uncharacterized conserved protein, contains S4-like domain